MGTKLSFKYDRDADILHIDRCPPYARQESEELGDDVIARLNPDTGEVENLGSPVLFDPAAARRFVRGSSDRGIAHHCGGVAQPAERHLSLPRTAGED